MTDLNSSRNQACYPYVSSSAPECTEINNTTQMFILHQMNVTISGNEFKGQNESVVFIYNNTDGNNLYDNNFENNGYSPFGTIRSQVYEGLEQIFTNRNTNATIGNYWSDYNGTDTDKDGIGDTPYQIDQNTTDTRPLMNRIKITKPNVTIYSNTDFTKRLVGYAAVNSVETISSAIISDTTSIAGRTSITGTKTSTNTTDIPIISILTIEKSLTLGIAGATRR